MPSHLLDHLNAVWLVALFLCLGLAPGTLMTSALRVPRYFWTPLVLGSASLIGYAIFWAYFFFPVNARLLSSAVPIFAAAWFAIVLTSAHHRETLRDRDAWLPIVLSAILMVAYQGYVLWAGVTSTVRFTLPLPPEDNIFPLYFANRLFNGLYTPWQTPPPFTTMLLEAQSSDRPPLQAGVVLAVRALGLGSGRLTVTLWSYGVLTAACQLGWVPALYALGRVLRFSRRQFTYVFVACACSGFFLMHSIYTWPKLYAAWLFITGLAFGLYLVREPRSQAARRGGDHGRRVRGAGDARARRRVLLDRGASDPAVEPPGAAHACASASCCRRRWWDSCCWRRGWRISAITIRRAIACRRCTSPA